MGVRIMINCNIYVINNNNKDRHGIERVAVLEQPKQLLIKSCNNSHAP